MNATHHAAGPDRGDHARFADTLDAVAAAPQPGNEELPYFFMAMARQRWGRDHCGTNWETALPARLAGQLAGAHRKACAIDAVAGLLLADFETRVSGTEEPRLTAVMAEGLFMALTELTGHLHDTLSLIGEQVERPGQTGARA